MNCELFVSLWYEKARYIDINLALFARQKIKILLLDTTSKKINVADIGLNKSTKMVYVPTFFDNRVVAYKFSMYSIPPILHKRQFLHLTHFQTREAKIIDYLAQHDVATFTLKRIGFQTWREVYRVKEVAINIRHRTEIHEIAFGCGDPLATHVVTDHTDRFADVVFHLCSPDVSTELGLQEIKRIAKRKSQQLYFVKGLLVFCL